ncbi:MAG: NUDIX hydrolase [Rhodobacterales bacterium]|nr:MAG: NUDIX hydrolase [Rhodobacterales bacterium]
MRKKDRKRQRRQVNKAVRIKHKPQRLDVADKRDVRTQFAALCYRVRDGKLQVLMITSRGSKRWIIPKGWPLDGETPAHAAATEAYEEAGVEGKISNLCLGIYSYTKTLPKGDDLPIVVAVFPLHVKRLLKKYPEAGQRKRKWVSLRKAAKMISDPELGPLISSFDIKRLKG